MEKTLINQAVKNAVGQESCENTSVQEAEKTDPAALSAREFEDFLASIVTVYITGRTRYETQSLTCLQNRKRTQSVPFFLK